MDFEISNSDRLKKQQELKKSDAFRDNINKMNNKGNGVKNQIWCYGKCQQDFKQINTDIFKYDLYEIFKCGVTAGKQRNNNQQCRNCKGNTY